MELPNTRLQRIYADDVCILLEYTDQPLHFSKAVTQSTIAMCGATI